MSSVATMQIETKWREASRCRKEKRWTLRRIEWARAFLIPCPYGTDWEQIRQIQRVQDNAANVTVPVARQGADPRLNAIHVLNTCSKSEILNSLHHEANRLVNPCLIRLSADYVAGVLSKQHVACDCYTHGFFRVQTHLLSVEIYCAILRLHDLVPKTAYLGPPLLPHSVEKGPSLLRVQQNGARVPAVCDRERIQSRKNSGNAGPGEAINSDHAQVLLANPRREPTNKILCGEKVAQVDRKIRASDRMIVPSDAAVHVSKEFVVDHRISCHIFFDDGLESRGGKQRPENILKRSYASLEVFEHSGSNSLLSLHALEHPSLDRFCARDGWQISQAQEVFAFEVSTLSHELFFALVIDDASDGIRKLLPCWIAWCLGADAVALHHPAT